MQAGRIQQKRDLNPSMSTQYKEAMIHYLQPQTSLSGIVSRIVSHVITDHAYCLGDYFRFPYIRREGIITMAWQANPKPQALLPMIRDLQGAADTRFHFRVTREIYQWIMQAGAACEVSDPSTLSLFLLHYGMCNLDKPMLQTVI